MADGSQHSIYKKKSPALLIPILKELEHTRIYTEIEMIRFPNIRIEYDIRDEE